MSEKKMNIVHEELAKFIMSNNIAFDVVESQYFVDFVKGVAECGLSYKLPSPTILKAKFVPNVEEEVKAYVRDVNKSWAVRGCTIMFYVESKSVDVYAYCLKGAVFLGSYKISSNGSIDVDFKNIFTSVIEEIGVEHVVQFITNHDSAFYSVGELLDCKFSKINKVRCVADMLHLLLKRIYKQVGGVKLVIDYAKLIVDYIYKDGVVLSLMKQYTNGIELKHPCVSKFASNYQMLQTVLQNEKGLRQLVASVEWSSNKTEKAAEVTGIITDSEFWREGREFLKVLEPLIQVLCLVEDEGGTSCYLYAAMKKAKEAIKEYCKDNNCKHNEAKMILELFEERRKDIVQPIHGAAAFLNPSYMCHENFEEDFFMKNGIRIMTEKMVAEGQKFGKELLLYSCKVSRLFTPEAKEMLEVYHPCVWWEYHGNDLPVLQKYALLILSQPCKCLWEHKFSPFEVAQTKKIDRAELQTRMNMKLMEKFRRLEAGLMVPMDLEKIRELPCYDDPEYDWTGNGNSESSLREEPILPDDQVANMGQMIEKIFHGQSLQHQIELPSMKPGASNYTLKEPEGQPGGHIKDRIAFLPDLIPGCDRPFLSPPVSPSRFVIPPGFSPSMLLDSSVPFSTSNALPSPTTTSSYSLSESSSNMISMVGQKRLWEEVGVRQLESSSTTVNGVDGEMMTSAKIGTIYSKKKNPSPSAMREIIIFKKELCPTDVKVKLMVPMATLRSINIPDGRHFVDFKATDTFDTQWNFRLSVRRNDPNPRPGISGDWLRFAREKRLKAGDRVTLGKNVDEATGDERYFIKAEREIRMFGNSLYLDLLRL